MIPGYTISVPIEVRWRDVDALGHVNNAVYFTYLEIARTLYLDKVFRLPGSEEASTLVVSARCDFVSQVTHGDPLEVGIRISAAGNTSFDYEYEIRCTGDGRVVARGASTQVLYDPVGERKLPITEEWLDRIEAAEGSRPPRRLGAVARTQEEP